MLATTCFQDTPIMDAKPFLTIDARMPWNIDLALFSRHIIFRAFSRSLQAMRLPFPCSSD